MSATSAHYARGKLAWGTCSRGGHRMLLRDMIRDPLTGLLVDPDWAELPLMRPAVDIIDGVVLRRPAPELDEIATVVRVSTLFDWATGEPPHPLAANYAPMPLFAQSTVTLATDDGEELATDEGEQLSGDFVEITTGALVL